MIDDPCGHCDDRDLNIQTAIIAAFFAFVIGVLVGGLLIAKFGGLLIAAGW